MPVLVSDRDRERTSPSQAHDIGGFLDVGREWLLDEHMAAGLKDVHRQPVVPEVRGEDAERVGAQPPQQPAVVGENAGRGPPWTSGLADSRGERLRARPIRVGTADDCDLGQCNEPIPMDPRRSTATGNPDP